MRAQEDGYEFPGHMNDEAKALAKKFAKEDRNKLAAKNRKKKRDERDDKIRAAGGIPPEPGQVYDPNKVYLDGRGATLEQITAAKRLLKIRSARDNLIDFVELTMPDPNAPDDPDKSIYSTQLHHKLIADALEKVERGETKRLAISMPPQHGKSELATRKFIAWFIGRNPTKHVIFGSYSQDAAEGEGAEVRSNIQNMIFRKVFDDVEPLGDSQSKSHMKTNKGGKLNFLGRGGAGTGKPAALAVIDDPIKDDIEAQSDTIRNQMWQWFTKVILTRCHTKSVIVVIHTRWHEDDLIGRLLDPGHPEYNKELAKEWAYLHIPAVLELSRVATLLGADPQPQTDERIVGAFGSGPIAALWPDKFSLGQLATFKKLNPAGFEALYQGAPSPEDGEYFKRDWFVPYKSLQELPQNLRFYAASDHALSVKKGADSTVLGCVGIDENDEIWIHPDLVWERMETDRIVEEMLAMMKRRKPMLWWAEGDVIKKAFGPFLRRRQREEKIYCTVTSLPLHGDKKVRARAIQGMASMGIVHIPVFAPWWEKAQNELLKFPNGTHDDFVDWFAWIGRGLDSEISASVSPASRDKNRPKTGTLAWIKQSAKALADRERGFSMMGGW